MGVLRQAAQTALDAYDQHDPLGVVMADLRAALAQPEPYPLPDALYDSKDWVASDYAGRVEWLHFMYESKKREVEQLETAQPEQLVVGGDDLPPLTKWTPMVEYAAKSAAVPGRAEALKQAGYTRRPRQLPKEDEQEPVAYQWLGTSVIRKRIPKTAEADAWQPLYTHPAHRKPLTDEEIEDLGPISFTWRDMVTFARAIERAHGIGGKHE